MLNYIIGDFEKIYLTNDEPLNVVGKDDVHIKMLNQLVWKLKNVRHVSDLKKNLISFAQLDAKGYVTTFVSSSWKITKGAMVVVRGSKMNILYMTSNIRDPVVLAQADSELWHCRLGHMSEKKMQVLLKKGQTDRSKVS